MEKTAEKNAPPPRNKRWDILLIAFLCGAAVWIVDAWLDHEVFYTGSLADLLIFKVPPHELYIRSLILALFLGFGWLAASMLRRQEAQAERLAVLAEERSVLLREANHRIKNNLQVVSGLVRLHESYVEDETFRGVLRLIIGRCDAISLLHKQVSDTSSDDCIDFKLFLEQLLQRISPLFERPDFNLHCDLKADDVCVTARQASPLALIVNELVANACEHAFAGRRSGTVFVHLKNSDGIRLTIHDDGKGLPEDFDISRSTSLGLSLVRNLAAQLDADLTICNRVGACFELTLPAKE